MLLSAAPLLCIKEFIVSVMPINGKSMTPTLNPDTMAHNERDWVLLDKLAVLEGSIKHGDIVTFTAPHDPDVTLVKRVVALEGDIVQTRPPPSLKFEYADKTLKFNQPPRLVKVPQGHCWVESDESYRGIDSNLFGPVPIALFQARVKYVVWPLSRMGKIPERTLRKGVEYSY
ncbi:UNVERIFIED_CONTAM: Mitochondrial inner membrane protease subunit 2 [Siphonaria sp. JEL0065]|nr:Mitochondrial inner membrane protease subunit 2 [Siphonaria sp. JEL0065]